MRRPSTHGYYKYAHLLSSLGALVYKALITQVFSDLLIIDHEYYRPTCWLLHFDNIVTTSSA